MAASITDGITSAPSSSLRREFITGVAWSVVRTWGGRFITALVFFALARLVAPTSFGLIALAGVFVDVIAVLQDQGLGQALVQRHEVTKSHVSSVFWFSTSLSALFAGALCATAGLWAQLLEVPRLQPVLYALAVAVLLTGLEGVPRALLTRELRFRALAVRDLVAACVGGALGLGLALNGFGAWALVGQVLADAALGCAWLWHAAGWRPKLSFRWYDVGELLPTSLAIFGISGMTLVMTRLDDLLVAGFLGTTALGFYTVAYRFYSLTSEATVSAAGAVCLPAFSRLQHDPPRLRDAVLRAMEATSLIGGSTFGALAVASPAILGALFGQRWEPAATAMSALLLLGIWQAIWFVLAWALVARGRARNVLVVSTWSALSCVVGFFVAVHWGYTAVAIAFTARAYLLVSPIALVISARALQTSVTTILRTARGGAITTGVTVCPLIALRLAWPPGPEIYWWWLVAAAGIWATALSVSLRLAGTGVVRDVIGALRESPAP